MNTREFKLAKVILKSLYYTLIIITAFKFMNTHRENQEKQIKALENITKILEKEAK